MVVVVVVKLRHKLMDKDTTRDDDGNMVEENETKNFSFERQTKSECVSVLSVCA